MRQLKGDKAPKEEVDKAVKQLLALKVVNIKTDASYVIKHWSCADIFYFCRLSLNKRLVWSTNQA